MFTVKNEDYILKKYKNKPPSVILHLHPTHFRFDQQDGSFSYTGPMKFFLEHLKKGTVPHEMLEELLGSGVRFYESCLIVQIHDHKSIAGKSSSTASNASTVNNYVPASIHNYNEHLTPSPYVPFPKKHDLANGKDQAEGQTGGDSSTMSNDKQAAQRPNTYHLVLFPTPLSMQEEVFIQSITPDPRAKGKQPHNNSRTPASASVPQTPLSAVPPTPSSSGQPPNKKLKMSISGSEIHAFESKTINGTGPPLYLDTVDSLENAHKLVQNMTDGRHKEAYPSPKKRKRTEAEVAADDAIAAQEQQFMLIMDERHGPSGSAAVKSGATDGETGTTAFQPDFEKFQAIKKIQAELKARHEQQAREKAERAQQELEEKMRREQQIRAHQEKQQRQQQMAQAQVLQAAQQQQQQQREIQLRENQRQQALAVGQNQLVHGHPLPNGMSQAQTSSPIVRNMTPATKSSPLVGSATIGGQGNTSSPARPPSAMQHGHPGSAPMTQQGSRQRAPSRTSTPQMNGTPAMPQATPRMNQSSPPMMATPVMNQNGMAAQHLSGQPQQMTDVQRQQEMQRRFQIDQQRQHHILQQQQRMQNGSPNPQMSPDRQSQPMDLQHQAALNQQRAQQAAAYRQSIQLHHQNMGNGPSPNPAHPQQAGHPQQQGQPRTLNPQQQALQQRTRQVYAQLMQQVAPRYGGNPANIPPQERHQLEARARASAQETIGKLIAQQRQQQQMMAMQMNGMNAGGQGMSGIMGGPDGQGMSEAQMAQLRQMQHMQRVHQQQQNGIPQGMQQLSQMPHMGGAGMGGQPGMNEGMGGMQ